MYLIYCAETQPDGQTKGQCIVAFFGFVEAKAYVDGLKRHQPKVKTEVFKSTGDGNKLYPIDMQHIPGGKFKNQPDGFHELFDEDNWEEAPNEEPPGGSESSRDGG